MRERAASRRDAENSQQRSIAIPVTMYMTETSVHFSSTRLEISCDLLCNQDVTFINNTTISRARHSLALSVYLVLILHCTCVCVRELEWEVTGNYSP